MKLKILPPTLRIKNRYLVLDIKSEFEFSKNELVLAIWDACIRFYGECETSSFNLWLMRLYNSSPPIWEQNLTENDEITLNNLNINYKSNFECFYQKAILKCRRNSEDKVRASLATMSLYKGKKIAIATIGISGSVSSSKHKFIN
ncbi:MAG: ribonuclease P [Methanobacteriaceae archaeon]|jgi:ribonuclease P/MRP protein subunit POP5|nr:ribonuclease P [Candidatus Methanorudis spinitermitis]